MPADIAAQIASAIRGKWDTPPVAHLKALGLDMSAEKARQLLFHPEEADMRLYPRLLAAEPAGAGSDHPQFKVMVTSLMPLYMAHVKSFDRMRPALVHLIAHPNLHVASQAMSALLDITHEEMYPWHDPPITSDGRGPKDGPDRVVWHRMYELSRSPLIPNLLLHQPDTFPGSSLLSLRLLAFYMSWLRCHFTPKKELRLSGGMLALLKEWASRSGIEADERELASQLRDDFSRFPPAEGSSAAEMAVGEEQVEDWNEPVTSVSSKGGHVNSYGSGAGATSPSFAAGGEAERLKDAGNRAYADGVFSIAIQLYSDALDVLVPMEALITEAPRRAVYHANRASAYLARAKGELTPGAFDDRGLLEGVDHGDATALQRHYKAALLDAESALELDGSYAKAHLRRATALALLARQGEALEAAHTGLALDGGGGGGARVPLGVARDLCALVEELEEQAARQQSEPSPAEGGDGSAASAPASAGVGGASGSNGGSSAVSGGGATADVLSQLAGVGLSSSDADAAARFVAPTMAAGEGAPMPVLMSAPAGEMDLFGPD
ncbi:hypothetical protein FOA52_016057 [Chlamydomonas sp. UWO 241]|nr:hypothetical protein FOA52_016057 [Chlamydomonas sp. UWO 241]